MADDLENNRKLQEKMARKLEPKLESGVFHSKNEFINEAAEEYQATRRIIFATTLRKHIETVSGLLSKHYRRVIPVFGKYQAGMLDIAISNDELTFDNYISKWHAQNGLKASKLIGETTRADVVRAIYTGVQEGEGVERIAKRIRNVTAISRARAHSIAVTETHNAATYAQEMVAQNSGLILEKRWLATNDERTRVSHAAMLNSKWIPFSDKFIVNGEKMSRPGDPNGSAANIISCRCGLLVREVELDE